MPFFPFYILSTFVRLDNRRVLMLVLILRNYDTLERRTFKEWSAILDLSTRWGFASIRELAIRCIDPPTDPRDRLILARKHAVEEWVLPALFKLCERPEPLGLEEARLMDFEDVVLVGSARQAVRSSILTVDSTGIAKWVRAWKSGEPLACSLVQEPLNNPGQNHLPQSGTFTPTLKPTGQPIPNGAFVSNLPTNAMVGGWGAVRNLKKMPVGKRR
jgi:hypothetical protein